MRHTMKLINLSRLAITALATMVIFGCGGGGGSGSSSGPVVPKAVITVGLAGTLAPGQLIGGVDFILNLPAGVTAQADGTGETVAGVVVPSGVAVGALPVGKYTASPVPANVRAILIKTAGFTTGNFVTINLDYTGSDPNVSGFSTSGLSVFDAASTTTAISGLTTTLALQIVK